MSHFYGTLQGNRGETTRCGTKNSGITIYAAGWGGAIRVDVSHDERDDTDSYEVYLVPWHSSGGQSRHLAGGVLSSRGETKALITRNECVLRTDGPINGNA